MFDHGADALVAILATLKAGKCYVVIDAGYPAERLRYMLADCGAPALIADEANLALAKTLGGSAIDVIAFGDTEGSGHDSDPGIDPAPESLAAILYTSGSTGRPKGVMHAHQNMLVDVRNLTNGWAATSQDRWLLHTSLSFANSVRTIYTALMNGAGLYLYDSKRKGFGDLPDWINGNRLTIFRTVSTFFRNFTISLDEARRFPSVRVVSVGGESMLRADLELFNRHFVSPCVLSHAFGPTECLTSCWILLRHGSQNREQQAADRHVAARQGGARARRASPRGCRWRRSARSPCGAASFRLDTGAIASAPTKRSCRPPAATAPAPT
jgi:non-ribosomal peptide synthetase component F